MHTLALSCLSPNPNQSPHYSIDQPHSTRPKLPKKNNTKKPKLGAPGLRLSIGKQALLPRGGGGGRRLLGAQRVQHRRHGRQDHIQKDRAQRGGAYCVWFALFAWFGEGWCCGVPFENLSCKWLAHPHPPPPPTNDMDVDMVRCTPCRGTRASSRTRTRP